MPRIPFIGATYTLQSIRADCQRCINMYPEAIESGDGANGEKGALFQVPGLTKKITVGDGPIRGLYFLSTGRLAVVSGNKLFRIDADWSSTFIGYLVTSTGYVEMQDNGTQLMIVDGARGYVVDLTTGVFNQIASGDFVSSNRLAYMDGYFITDIPASGQFGISSLYDGTSWPALDVASAEGSPDPVVGVLVNQRQLWVAGTQSIEVYWDSGDNTFPFTRIEGSLIEFGCSAPATFQKFGGTVAWLNNGGQVMAAEGYKPVRISNFAVEEAIKNTDNIGLSTAFSYKDGGHTFYVLNLTGSDTTWVYDLATRQWHERVELLGGIQYASRVSCHAQAYGFNLAGDSSDGRIYIYDSAAYSNDGDVLFRRRRAPHLTNNLNRFIVDMFQLDLDTGYGENTGQGQSPNVMLRVSKDGGRTWGKERWVSAGQIGAFRTRAIWRQIGLARDFVFEVTITDPVKSPILGAIVNSRKCLS